MSRARGVTVLALRGTGIVPSAVIGVRRRLQGGRGGVAGRC